MKTYKIKCSDCNAMAINGTACHESGCNGVMQFQSRGKTYVKYRVWSLDVFGNAREGFEVNDRSERGAIMIPIDAPDKELIRALKRADFLNPKCHFKSFRIDGEQACLMVDAAKTGEPIYQLEIV